MAWARLHDHGREQELATLELVAHGLTDRQIGAEMFLAGKAAKVTARRTLLPRVDHWLRAELVTECVLRVVVPAWSYAEGCRSVPSVFDPGSRARVREWLLDLARADTHVTAAALVGSAATGREDEWSDIDLALRLADTADPVAVAADWSRAVRARFPVADQLDVWSGGTLFRVFFLVDTLQVDVSFWPGPEFAATGGGAFRLVFGDASAPTPPTAPAAHATVGMGWLYALHVRSSLARGRPWQALHMINGMRDQVIELACARHDLPVAQGRGVDGLPAPVRDSLQETLIGSLDDDRLLLAFERLGGALLIEAGYVDTTLTARLTHPLRELIRTSRIDPDR